MRVKTGLREYRIENAVNTDLVAIGVLPGPFIEQRVMSEVIP